MTMENNKKIHLFDVDKTVVRKTSAEYFLIIALKEGFIKYSQINRLPFDWIKYKLTLPDMDFIENTVKKLSGLKRTDIDYVAEKCFINRLKPNIFSGAAQLINEKTAAGEKVIFATSSFDFIIKPLERFFGIEGSLASRMEFKDGITTGNIDGYSFFGSKKKDAAKEWMNNNGINPLDVCFYTDSYTDIPLLEYCGTAVAVNPDRILTKKAKKQGWKILKFKKVLGSSAG